MQYSGYQKPTYKLYFYKEDLKEEMLSLSVCYSKLPYFDLNLLSCLKDIWCMKGTKWFYLRRKK